MKRADIIPVLAILAIVAALLLPWLGPKPTIRDITRRDQARANSMSPFPDHTYWPAPMLDKK